MEEGLPLSLDIFQQDTMKLEVLESFMTTDDFDFDSQRSNLQNIPTTLLQGSNHAFINNETEFVFCKAKDL